MRRFMRTIQVALVLALVMLLAKMILPIGEKQLIFSPGGVEARSNIGDPQGPDSTDQSRISEILTRNPFGPGKLGATDQTNAGNLASASGLAASRKLLGTIAGSPQLARAMIQNTSTGETAYYRIGDSIGNAVITEIHNDRVILIDNQTQEAIELAMGNRSSGETRRPAAEAAPGIIPDAPAPAGHSPIQLSSDSILGGATIIPHVVSGRMEGLQIADLTNVPYARLLGLQKGDIIKSVNGQAITSTPQAFQIMKKAKSLPKLSLDLDRQGRTHNLTFNLE